LLVFGGTRYDKGADLAVRMLSYLPPTYHLLFAGRDTFFSQNYLKNLAIQSGVIERLHFDSRFIPEDEVPVYFCGCDIVLLPYRRIFPGQSGPLTIALSVGTKVVAPNLPIMVETISKYSLGWLYPVENEELMAKSILDATNETLPPASEKFYNEHCAPTFASAVAASYSKAIFQSGKVA